MAAILDFGSGRFLLFLIYKSPQCFLPSFKSIGLSVQEKKQKIDFQDGDHLKSLTGMILAILDLQVTPMLPTKFQVHWPFGSGGETKNSWLVLDALSLVGPTGVLLLVFFCSSISVVSCCRVLIVVSSL